MALVFLCLAIFSYRSLEAQEKTIYCGSDAYLQHQQSVDPNLDRTLNEVAVQTRLATSTVELRSRDTIVIPVIFHIIYQNELDNLSLALIESQLEALNQDFLGLDPSRDMQQYPQIATPYIKFIFAPYDPNGKPSTGIIRKKTDQSSFTRRGDAIKFDETGGSDAWPRTDYLNIWVGVMEGGYLGYAQFPGGGKAATDGIVINTRYFGRRSGTSLGRTAVHEVGHWLNLQHIWGRGCQEDDGVADTPNAEYPGYGCPQERETCGNRDMIGNLMDLSDDNCMNLFTQGQVDRMRAQFAPGGFRESLLYSIGIHPKEEECNGCEGNPPPEVTCPAPQNLSFFIQNGYFKASWEGMAENYVFQLKLPFMNQWIELSRSGKDIAGYLSGFTAFEARVRSVCGSEKSDWAFFQTSSSDRKSSSPTGSTFTVRPNPVGDIAQIEWMPIDFHYIRGETTLREIGKHTYLSLYNTNGVRVYHQACQDEQSASVNVQGWSAGLYFVLLTDEQGYPIHRAKLMVH